MTTHDEECGIAKYQEQFLVSMKSDQNVANEVFSYSPNVMKKMTPERFKKVFDEFSKQLDSFDIVHIQHEFSFYAHNELQQFINEARRQSKKVVVTVHTSLNAGIPDNNLQKLLKDGPRHYVGTRRLIKHQIKVHAAPLRKANLILVHNSVTKESLIKYGVREEKILKIIMPVPQLNFAEKTTSIASNLSKKDCDIIFCTVGFLSETKGIRDAVKALQELPDNYKLAMIGGAHPSGANDAFCNEIKGIIEEQGLKPRAYMTGYIKDDNKLNALIRECDICIYPFNEKYYAGVSSASLNNSLANYKPAIAYPTEPILEMNEIMPAVVTCKAFDYRELAQEIKNLDIEKQTAVSRQYAETFSYSKEAAKLVSVYSRLREDH